MSFYDPFNAYVCHSNQCDVTPSKNLEKKLSHFIVVLSPISIHVLLYSFKNISGSSPLLPLKIEITIVIIIIIILKSHQIN